MTFCEVNPYANRALAYALLGMEAEAHENIDRAVELGADRARLETWVNEFKKHR